MSKFWPDCKSDVTDWGCLISWDKLLKNKEEEKMKDEEYFRMKSEEGDFRVGKTKLPWDDIKDIDKKTYHKIISYIKSVVRLIACGFGIFLVFDIAFFVLAIAEVLGIIEEIRE